jgi:hypothetical protein
VPALLVHAPVVAARQRGDATSRLLPHDGCYTTLLRGKVLGERSREHIPALVTSAGWLLGQQPPVELETAPSDHLRGYGRKTAF